MKKSRLIVLSRFLVVALLMPLFLSACASSSMMGRSYLSDSYAIGFHDGRHTGLSKSSDALIKDVTRFAKDENYREGWIVGEKEGIRIRKESLASKGVVSESKPSKGEDKTAPSSKAIDPSVIQDKESAKLKF